jgi:hypothetical protein
MFRTDPFKRRTSLSVLRWITLSRAVVPELDNVIANGIATVGTEREERNEVQAAAA